MKCIVKFNNLSRYTDSACSLKEKQAIKTHLEQCAKCGEILARLKLLKQSLAELPAVRESSNFDFVFNQKLKERLEKRALVSLNQAFKNAAKVITDVFVFKVPALVKVSVFVILIMAILFGSYNYYVYIRLPFIETVSGGAQIYKAATERYIIARPDLRLRQGDRIKTAKGAVVDITSRGKYAARIKEDSDITIARLNVLKNNHGIEFDINSGKFMVNTTKGFKGSHMALKTPTCNARVVGTAFVINVDKKDKDTTWLGVLEGKVGVSSQGKDVYVNAGQKTEVRPGAIPDAPTLLSDNEWKQMQQLYQLGEKPQVALLISVRANRVNELLKPAPLYISDAAPRTIPEELEQIIHITNKAIEDNDIKTHSYAIEKLEQLVRKHPDPRYNPQFLMFIGSYCYYIQDYKKAIDTFASVVNDYPDYALSSLAQCAVATIYKDNLKDQDKAKTAYQKLLEEYPDSIDAAMAREFFKNLME